MLYVTGDIHGDLGRFQSKAFKKLKKGDTLLVCGDFGFLWDQSEKEQKILHKLGKKKYQILFVEGTHDNYDALEKIPPESFCGGMARHLTGNIYQLLRGEIFTLEGKTVLAFGGGQGQDSDLRELGKTWWAQELPSEEEMALAKRHLEEQQYRVDYILTHDCSSRIRRFLLLQEEDSSPATVLHHFFDELSAKVSFQRWAFGMYHLDKEIPPCYRTVFQDLVPLKDC